MRPYLSSPVFIVLLLLAVAGSSQVVPPPPPPPDTISVEGKIFEEVEVEANFPGGDKAWLNYLINTVKGDVATKNGAPIGQYTVVAQFVVLKDGTIGDIKMLTNFGFGMEQEVIRTLKLSGTWNPAIQNGRPVKAYRKQPVTFQVVDENINIVTKTPYVLYIGKQNNITIAVNKVKPEDLEVSISQGSIINKGDGLFVAKVNKPGRAIVSISNSKKNKELAEVSFEVREK